VKAKVPQDVQDAFAVLKMNREFKEVVKWLQSELESTREANDALEGTALTRSQGQAITLAKILKTIEEAE
jgi:3-methyladenine DNA glycosylase Tag